MVNTDSPIRSIRQSNAEANALKRDEDESKKGKKKIPSGAEAPIHSTDFAGDFQRRSLNRMMRSSRRRKTNKTKQKRRKKTSLMIFSSRIFRPPQSAIENNRPRWSLFFLGPFLPSGKTWLGWDRV